MARHDDEDPYYVHPEYEAGKRDRNDELVSLVNHLGTVIDELSAYILRLDEIEKRALTQEEDNLVALGMRALKNIDEVL